jgi:hypothetical protein
VEIAYVDQGYTGEDAARQAKQEGITLEVERSFAWLGRFRRLARDYERLATTLAGWHWLAFAALLLAKVTAKSA